MAVEKWKMNFTINGQPATITRFKVGDCANKGFLALYYDPSVNKDVNIKKPTFFSSKEEAESYLSTIKDKEDGKIQSLWYNKELA